MSSSTNKLIVVVSPNNKIFLDVPLMVEVSQGNAFLVQIQLVLEEVDELKVGEYEYI